MTVDYWELVGTAPPGGLDTIINEESGWDILLDQGHATLRGKTKVRLIIWRCKDEIESRFSRPS